MNGLLHYELGTRAWVPIYFEQPDGKRVPGIVEGYMGNKVLVRFESGMLEPVSLEHIFLAEVSE